MESNCDFLLEISTRSRCSLVYEPQAVVDQNGSLSDLDAFEDALSDELSFLDSGRPLSSGDVERLNGLFRWFVSQLVEVSEPPLEKPAPLELVLHVCARLDFGTGQLWTELFKVGSIRIERLQEFEEFISTRPVRMRRPSRANHQTEQYTDACRRRDWLAFSRLFYRMDGLFDDLPLSCATRATYLASPDRFQVLLSSVQNPITLVNMIQSLECVGEFSALKVGIESNNWVLKFLSLYLALKSKDSSEPKLEGQWEALLMQAAGNNDEWEKWARLFHPAADVYPMLQRAFGRALCAMPKDAVAQYFRTVRIIKSTVEVLARPNLKIMFETIQEYHDPERRHLIWKLAFERWTQWIDGEDSRPTGVGGSSLDLAVYAYFRDCLSLEERLGCEEWMYKGFQESKNCWYRDLSDYIAAVNRHMSRYQPFAHAQSEVPLDEEWLSERFRYSPGWLPQSDYFDMIHSL